MELEGFENYNEREGKGASDNPQKWLQDVLSNEKLRLKLINNFKEKFKK